MSTFVRPATPSRSASPVSPLSRVFQHSAWDALLVMLAVVHGVILISAAVFLPTLSGFLPTIAGALVIAVGLWWNSNSISHNFIHNPFFASRGLNFAFALFLSLLLGFPQSLWRTRHLAHHAGAKPTLRISLEFVSHAVAVVGLWVMLAALVPTFFVSVYLPGWLLGLGLCAVQGHYEHARGTISSYGRIYNLLFFRDGLHVEHHAHPRHHWTTLTPAAPIASTSRWPPVLRWLDGFSLEGLERVVLRSAILQRWLLRTHGRAFEMLLSDAGEIRSVGIVGGGLFPRSAIVLRKLLPDARMTIIDMSRASLESAAALMPDGIEQRCEMFDPGRRAEFDLLVIPLSLKGDREAIYRHPPARLVLIHDWVWRSRAHSHVVSWLLLKRLNRVPS